MSIDKSFPELKPDERDREYRRYTEELRDRVIFEFLFNGRSNRWIDENILLENQEYSRGWFSMGILHHFGLRNPHKGFFSKYDMNDAIKYLTELNKDQYNPIIGALKRYALGTYDLYLENSLEMFLVNRESKKLLKKVGNSQYTDGVRIDKEFHEIFNPEDSKFFVPRGKAREIKVLFNNKIFSAEYRFEDQTDKSIVLQSIRFRKELKKEFEKVFPTPEGEFTIEVGSDLCHFIFSHIAVTIEEDLDPECKDEYSEGKEYYRLHRMRERKSGVVKQAKKLFIKKHGRLFCEVCSADFPKIYGDRGNNFIEGHHRKLVSEMKEGDKTKIEDIAMLCSNCHRMIHKKPIISVEDLAKVVRRQTKVQ
ncbi:HNH endonuclease [Desulfosporosinus hippei]|uniref:HNH endonuclease n=1 Tax=Desulfosporosinus hippei DSM 8344 TaxID=1121419 RepID=A0A1G7Z4M5_9FIRM|nr:HNH endonuclease [Desulfosporosinus hippei]SDH03668.1 HNH endonuclease [Desulfosporosinus hippei DSM 8344]